MKIPLKASKIIKKKIEQEKKKRKKKAIKYLKVLIRKRKFIFLSDLKSILQGQKATKTEKQRLLAKRRIFTGIQTRSSK